MCCKHVYCVIYIAWDRHRELDSLGYTPSERCVVDLRAAGTEDFVPEFRAELARSRLPGVLLPQKDATAPACLASPLPAVHCAVHLHTTRRS